MQRTNIYIYGLLLWDEFVPTSSNPPTAFFFFLILLSILFIYSATLVSCSSAAPFHVPPARRSRA